MTTTTLTDLEIANLATRVAYMTDPEAIKAATDGQWVRVAVQKDPSGYQGVLIYNKTTNTYALLNAGTNGLEDIPSDVSLFFRNIAKTELDDAVNFARDIKTLIANSDHPDATFLIGGHSLGDWISKALVSLGFGSAPNGQAVSFGIDGPGLSPFKTEMADYAAEKGLPYDPSRAENGRYIISANSPISFGMDGYTNVRTDAVLTALEHVGWGYQAGIYIRTELQQAGYGDVQSRNLSQSEGVTLGIPASTFELNPRVTGFFDSTGKLVAYAQIGVNGNQVDLNAIQFYGMNGFDRYGTVTSGANEQLTCAISHKEGNVTTTQVDDGCNTSIEQIVTDSFDNAGNKTTSTKNLNANGTVKNEVVVTVSTNRETTVTKTDSNGDSVFDDVKVVEAVSDSASILTEDTDNNGSVDTRYLVNNGQTYDLENVNEAITADNIFRQFYGQGRLNSGEYLSLSQIVSQTLTSYYNPIYLPTYSIPVNSSLSDKP